MRTLIALACLREERAKAEREGQWRQPATAGSLVASEKHGQIEEPEESKSVFTPG